MGPVLSASGGVRALSDAKLAELRAAGAQGDLGRLSLCADLLLSLHRLAGEGTPAGRRAVHHGFAARLGLEDDAVRLIDELVVQPQRRERLSAHERWVFAARFGEAALNLLDADEEGGPSLPALAARLGPAGALLLLDAQVRLAVADGGLSDEELAGVHRTAQGLGVDEVLVSSLLHHHAAASAPDQLRVKLDRPRTTVGRAPGNDLRLPDPQVGARHFEIVRVTTGFRVVDLGSGRPTLLGGSPVAAAPLERESVLQVAHYSLRIEEGPDGPWLVAAGDRRLYALSVEGLTRRIGATSLLDGVSFTVFSGEVVALIGPSGAGKTTLLNAISGVAPADSGKVTFDGKDFHGMLAADRSLVGIVPQDDLVHPELTVSESLQTSGRLRFPPGTPRDEINAAVGRVEAELGIGPIANNRIGDALKRGISGGQRKRVNLGQELLTSTTRVLFLDEPTSGLDPRASQDIVRLIRQLADRGRIIFLVTHDLSPEVLAQVDHLVVLAPGGRLGFFGPPEEAARYFGVATPDAIFNRFGDHGPEEWARRFRASELHRSWVLTRAALTSELRDGGLLAQAAPPLAPARSGGSATLHQLRVLVERTARVRLRDRTGVLVLGVQPLVLAAVTWVVFAAPTAQLLFMVSLSCLWFGMSGAVRELISDRVIWRRERRVGVGVLPYVGSKVLVLGVITALQCSFLSAFVYFALSMSGYGFDLAKMALVTTLTGWVGMSVGLLVSAIFVSSEAAVGTLPLLLIPQITFSSIMVSLRDMRPLARGVTHLTIERYAFDALIKCGERVAVASSKAGEWKERPINGSLWQLGLKMTDAAEDQGYSLTTLILALGATAATLLLATVGLVRRRDPSG